MPYKQVNMYADGHVGKCHMLKVHTSLVTEGKNLPPPMSWYCVVGTAPSFAISIPNMGE